MQGRFLDGLSARAHTVDVVAADRALHISGPGLSLGWPLDSLSVVIEADQVRLSHRSNPDARLVLAARDWALLAPADRAMAGRKTRRRETRLVIGLCVFAAATTAFVFVGVPALSGPLARATPVSFEQGMGRNFDVQIGVLFKPCTGQAGQDALARLGDRIEAVADTPFDIRVRAVEAPMLNAFALPGGAVVVTDDLIADARTPDELAAVIAHEAAHVEKRHVMQSVWRSLGIGLLLDAVVGGGTGAGQQAVLLAGQATNLRYGRKAESEADARGQVLLHSLNLSSKGMASFFARLGPDDAHTRDLEHFAEFAATHPASANRARAARAVERPGTAALDDQEWKAVKAACAAPSRNPSLRGFPDL